MDITYDDVDKYLKGVKEAIRKGDYRIDRHERRKANVMLYKDYVIDENKSKEIILDLQVQNFCARFPNEHEGFEHEMLYVFGAEVKLLQRFGDKEESVPLYIKFNQLENKYVIVISFHKQEYPLKYYFN